eukprot:COSAG02_NODE_3381_length_6837_cov_83.054022_4_plen_39_part_00
MTSGRQVDTQYLRKMPTRQQEVRLLELCHHPMVHVSLC